MTAPEVETVETTGGPVLERVSPALVPDIKRFLARHRVGVEEIIARGTEESGLPAGRLLTKAYDGLLSALFHAARAALTAEGAWQPVSLAGVGSYGRGSVALHSDLDVRLLCDKDTHSAHGVAETLLYPLWDAGISIGHQVVTPEESIELARDDMPTATSLLDWRPLAGSAGPADKRLELVYEGVFGPSTLRHFLEGLGDRAASSRERYGGSVYLLEPDLKNGPGGLRDLDVAHWAARARWRIRDLSELVRIGVLVPREWQPIDDARRLIWRIRNLMHLKTGRCSDRLSFDLQEEVAERLGYGTGGAAAEKLMSDYYRQARLIRHTSEMILAKSMPPPRRRPVEQDLGAGLKMVNGSVSLSGDAALDDDPALALRLYERAVELDAPIYQFARDQVARATVDKAFCERLRANTDAADLFVRLVRAARTTRLEAGSVLRELHDVGLMLAMIPEFTPVVGRVHHDTYHVLTVDAHSIAAVDRVAALRRGDLAAEYPLGSWLAAELTRPRVLTFAALLHDVGKDEGGKNHSERGAVLAEVILKRLGLRESEIRDVQSLIRQHLVMYHTATRRDLDDPQTLEDFCARVGNREGLRKLYLLTIADVSTTSPQAMTAWKARMLEELFVAADRALVGGLAVANDETAARRRREVRAELSGSEVAVSAEFADEFLDALPDRYLHANEPDGIVKHLRVAAAAVGQAARLEVIGVDEPYVEVVCIGDDRPGLLADLAAIFAASRLKVMGAQVCTWQPAKGPLRALDGFWLRGRSNADSVKKMLAGMQRDLAALSSGDTTAAELVASRRTSRWNERRAPDVTPRVSIDNRAGRDHTVIEIIAPDRLGLLYSLAHALSAEGLSIAVAKINTEGARIADVFYVSDAGGNKLTDDDRVSKLKKHLLSSIADLEVADEI
jgi:[protein-PII] uridylyltransferase